MARNSRARLQRILDTEERRARIRGQGRAEQIAQQLLDSCHPKQRALVADPAREIAALCGGRAGKTTGGRARFLRKMLRVPRARCLYIATTRVEAEKLMWEPLKQLDDELELGATFAESKLLMALPNGSTLRLGGADDKKQIEKYRGQPWHEVQLDEVASYSTKLLNWLIDRIIGPRLGDFGGVLVMYGTPSHIVHGDFYEATRPDSEVGIPYERREDPDYADREGWSTHAWNAKDGADAGVPAMVSAWADFLERKRRRGWSDDHPVWRREYLGFWASDDTEGMYRYRAHLDGKPWNRWSPERDAHGFAILPKGEWVYGYGLDLGHSDPFALQIGAVSATSRELKHVYEFQRRHMTVRAIAELLVGERWVKRILNGQDPGAAGGVIERTGWPYGIVADVAGSGATIIQELNEVYGIPVKAAPRGAGDKHDAIELTNGDLIDGRIQVLEGSELEAQMSSLQWAVDTDGKLKEDKGQRNDCADAFVYMRREIMHLVGRDDPTPPTPDEEIAAWLQKTAERSAARRDRKVGDEWPDEPVADEWDDAPDMYDDAAEWK